MKPIQILVLGILSLYNLLVAATPPTYYVTWIGGTSPRFGPSFGAELGRPATAYQASTPAGMALDVKGNLYVANGGSNQVWIVNRAGVIVGVVGTGTPGYSGDGGRADAARLSQPTAVALDSAGAIYIADSGNSRIRKVVRGIISTVAGGGIGNGQSGFGDGGAATSAVLGTPRGVSLDSAGAIYIADYKEHRIRRVFGGIISTIAGNGSAGYSGDGGKPESAALSSPASVAVDRAGTIYVAEYGNSVIRKISGGTITTFAGRASTVTGKPGGVMVNLLGPNGVSVDDTGSVYVADSANYVVRRISNGEVTTLAGTGQKGFSGDGGSATAAKLNYPMGVLSGPSGLIYVSDSFNSNVRKITSGVISSFVGLISGFPGDGGYATDAILFPCGVALDKKGIVYVLEADGGRVRKIERGVISTIASTQRPAGELAVGTQPGIAVDNAGDVYYSDSYNHLVRKISEGKLSIVAGSGKAGYQGDGGAATDAQLSSPAGVAVDKGGNLYIADNGNQVIRRVTGGVITTFAGNGRQGLGGDDGPAIAAQLDHPAQLAVDTKDNLYIADSYNNRIRAIENGRISTKVGSGPDVFGKPSLAAGDGGPPTSAILEVPLGVTVRDDGDIFITEPSNVALRAVLDGLIYTIAGGRQMSGVLDAYPVGVALDGIGNVYVATTAEVLRFSTTPPVPDQSIDFPVLATATINTAPFLLTATATSGLAVEFWSNDTSVCTVTGSTVRIVGPGECSITAAQPGDDVYPHAQNVVQAFTVLAPQAIRFDALRNGRVGMTADLNASASSALPVGFASTTPGVCGVSGTALLLLGPGVCSVTATQAGDGNYAAAEPVVRRLFVGSAR